MIGLVLRAIDCLRQWQNAELANDPEELHNARYERDQILNKLKEQANAQSTEREATPREQANKAGGQVEITGTETGFRTDNRIVGRPHVDEF